MENLSQFVIMDLTAVITMKTIDVHCTLHMQTFVCMCSKIQVLHYISCIVSFLYGSCLYVAPCFGRSIVQGH